VATSAKRRGGTRAEYRLPTGCYTAGGFFVVLFCVINQQQNNTPTKTTAMKKLLTLAALFFAFAIATQAQQVYHATKSRQGAWNANTQSYSWGATNYNVDIRFTIQGDIVLVGDRAGSTYTTSTQITNQVNNDGSHEYAWKARDEKGTGCIFKLINYNDGSKLMEVFYSDYAYMYAVE
jgi:hypothetical protein